MRKLAQHGRAGVQGFVRLGSLSLARTTHALELGCPQNRAAGPRLPPRKGRRVGPSQPRSLTARRVGVRTLKGGEAREGATGGAARAASGLLGLPPPRRPSLPTVGKPEKRGWWRPGSSLVSPSKDSHLWQQGAELKAERIDRISCCVTSGKPLPLSEPVDLVHKMGS